MTTFNQMLLLTLSMLTPCLLQAGDSDLDPTFGDGGLASTFVGTTGNGPAKMTLQPDGKIVMTGGARDNQSLGSYGNDVALVRFNSDGSLDTSFSEDGKVATDIGSDYPVYTDDSGSAVAIQPDNKIIVAGTTRSYTKSGSSSFEWYMWDLLLLRYEPDGTLDSTFGDGGKVVIDITGNNNIPEGFRNVALQSDGKIIGVGYTYPGNNRFLVARFNTDGSLDTTFGKDGTGTVIEHFSVNTLEDAYSVVILPDDSMVVAGRGIKSDGNASVSMLKLTAEGILDTSFNGSGKTTISVDSSSTAGFITTDSSGRLILAGRSGGGGTAGANDENAMIMRYNPDGSLDTTFNGTGIFTTSYGDYKYEQLYSLQVQDDGKLFAVGRIGYPSQMTLLRVNEDGTPDESFGPGGKVAFEGTDGYYPSSTGLDADGKLLLGLRIQSSGDYAFSVMRFGGPDVVVRWNEGYTDLNDSWQELPWFGTYMPMQGEWIYHMDHEFIHVIADGSADGLYFYSDDGDWLWTNDAVNPYYYNITTGLWEPDVPTD